ncbi:MAG TPA: helix-turn-helix domain-containing protein [Thermoanaerobaculia bacterium]|nr:helix-turn-helix domain-containing protein [Thermoanaerobaculia bacterium]
MDEVRAFWLAAAERYIEDCWRNATSVRVSEFAVCMKRTAVQLGREFQASVGIGVKDYFSRRQIDCAKKLLRTTGQSTAQIAIDSGFGTARTFYRAFKRSAGRSPTAFRKEMSLGKPEFGP